MHSTRPRRDAIPVLVAVRTYHGISLTHECWHVHARDTSSSHAKIFSHVGTDAVSERKVERMTYTGSALDMLAECDVSNWFFRSCSRWCEVDRGRVEEVDCWEKLLCMKTLVDFLEARWGVGHERQRRLGERRLVGRKALCG